MVKLLRRMTTAIQLMSHSYSLTCVFADARLTVSKRVREVSIPGQIAKLSRPMWKREALATVMVGLQNPAGTVTVIMKQDGVKNNFLCYFLGRKAALYT